MILLHDLCGQAVREIHLSAAKQTELKAIRYACVKRD